MPRPSAACVAPGCQSCAALQQDNANGNSLGLRLAKGPELGGARGVDGEQNGEQASGDIKPRAGMDTRVAADGTLIGRYALALAPAGAGIKAAVTAASVPPLSGGPGSHGSGAAHAFTIAGTVAEPAASPPSAGGRPNRALIVAEG